MIGWSDHSENAVTEPVSKEQRGTRPLERLLKVYFSAIIDGFNIME